jgi:hypothetical protein
MKDVISVLGPYFGGIIALAISIMGLRSFQKRKSFRSRNTDDTFRWFIRSAFSVIIIISISLSAYNLLDTYADYDFIRTKYNGIIIILLAFSLMFRELLQDKLKENYGGIGRLYLYHLHISFIGIIAAFMVPGIYFAYINKDIMHLLTTSILVLFYLIIFFGEIASNDSKYLKKLVRCKITTTEGDEIVGNYIYETKETIIIETFEVVNDAQTNSSFTEIRKDKIYLTENDVEEYNLRAYYIMKRKELKLKKKESKRDKEISN